jgi:hypothetical protein
MYQPKGSSTATGPSHQGEEQCQQQEPVDQDVAKPHEVKDGRASSHGNQAEKKQAEDTSKEKPGRLSCSMLGHLEG